MSDVFLNSTNIKNFDLTEVIDSIIDGTMTYDNTHRVTRIEILNDGTSNIYGVEI